MYSLHPALQTFVKIAKINSLIHRKFEGYLDGLSFTEFTLLLHLSKAPKEVMRMTDAAEHVGLTPSGITRILLPMEKIGLIKKERNPHDARSSLIHLTPGGKTKLHNALHVMEEHCEEVTHTFTPLEMEHTLEAVKKLGSSLA